MDEGYLFIDRALILTWLQCSVCMNDPGLFDVALTDKDGYFVGDVALRFWVREDGEGDVPPARGT